MPLTPEDVSNKRFTPVRLREGYDMGEVDQFLDEVESELERLLKENEDLRSKLTAAQDGAPVPVATPAESAPAETTAPVETAKSAEPERPAAAAEPEPPREEIKVTTAAEASSAATRLLELATRNADEVVAEARQDAERIVTEARTSAEQVEESARSRAQNLDSETDARRTEVLGEIEKEKGRLDGEIENLRAFEREYRSRLRSYFTSQLQSLDGTGEGGDASALEGDGLPDQGQHAQGADQPGDQPDQSHDESHHEGDQHQG